MAESGSGIAASGWADSPAAAGAGSSVSAGASSRIRWALVPLMPKEETPARRGRSPRSQGSAALSSSSSPASQSTCGVGSSTCRVGGSSPSRIAIAILITPATPAAAWVWPMFDLIEPRRSGSAPSRSWP